MNQNFLSSIVDKMEQTKAEIEKETEKNALSEKVIKLEPNEIGNWEYRDRQEFELGNIEELANSIELKGQAQPIIVVAASGIFKSSDSSTCNYIVIAGYRRWLACKFRNLRIDAIVRQMTMEQAIACLVAENEKEKVSDFSKGMFYFKLLKKECVTKKALYEKLGLNKGVFDNYLSFSEVPSEVWSAVDDMSKVSSRTSATIKLLCLKGDDYKNAVIAIADKIAEGIGEKKITALVDKALSRHEKESETKNATRVAFSDLIYMEHKKDQIKLDLKKMNTEQIELLKVKITEVLSDFIKRSSLV